MKRYAKNYIAGQQRIFPQAEVLQQHDQVQGQANSCPISNLPVPF